jgi:hypothetical protein
MIAPPSPHPIGGVYRWISGQFDDPPYLPDEIVTLLRTEASGRGLLRTEDATPAEVRDFFDKYNSNDRPDLLRGVVAKYRKEVDSGAGRYPSLRDALIWGFEEAVSGFYPAKEVALALVSEYRQDLETPPRRPWDRSEWNRLLSWAVGRAGVTDTGDREARADKVEVHATFLDVPDERIESGDPIPDDEQDLATLAREREIASRVRALQIEREARRRINQAEYVPSAGVLSLVDLMAQSSEPQRWRVGGPSTADDAFATPGALDNTGLMAVGASVILTGIRKGGKTTIALDLARCFADGDLFLGRFPVDRPDGGLFIMDYESSVEQFRTWYGEAGIMHPERIFVKLLRGQPNPFSTEQGRLDLIEEIKITGATALLVDPMSVLLEACREDENDNAGTRRGLDDLRRLADTAGVSEIIVLAHAGKDGARGARGASAIEDWPDAIWRLHVDGEGAGALRTFSAFGRDVDVEQSIVRFDHATRRPVLSKPLTEAQADEEIIRLQRKADIQGFLLACLSGDAGPEPDRGWRTRSAISKSVPGLGGSSTVAGLLDEMVLDGFLEKDSRRVAGRTTDVFRGVKADDEEGSGPEIGEYTG